MSWSPLLVAHVGAAVVAVVLGAFQLRRTKGGLRHRRLGYVWSALIAFVAISSFWIREIVPGRLSPIHALSVLTLVTLSLGHWAGATQRPRLHRGNMVGTYIGLCGAGLGAILPPQRLIPTLAREDLVAFTSWTAAFVAAGVALALSVGPRPPRKQRARDIPA